MRLLLVTGKGGVGKTTVAAATAARCAADGQRTLLLSADPAHSLADALDTPLGDAPAQVAPRLDAAQIDGRERLAAHWEEVRAYAVSLLEWSGLDGVSAEEVAVLPGLEELLALDEVRRRSAAGEHDVLVVDCAPTAEALRLLALPDSLGWCLERAFDLERPLTRALRPLLGRGAQPPAPGRGLRGSVERLYAALQSVRDLLLDGDRTTVRLVCAPERIVVAETRRLRTSLSLFGYRVDALVANRLLPPDVEGSWLASWQARQERQLAALARDFSDTPVLRAGLAADEVVGVAAHERLGAELYDGCEPAGLLGGAAPLALHEDGDEVRLALRLPFAVREEVDVFRRADELFVRVDGQLRSLVLPARLRRSEVLGAGLTDGGLEVRFDAGRRT